MFILDQICWVVLEKKDEVIRQLFYPLSFNDLREKKKTKSLVDRLLKKVQGLTGAPSDSVRQKLEDDINMLGRSNVTVYGTIYLKTDGNTLA